MGKVSPIAINDKCVGCSKCINDCPASALIIENGKAKARVGCIECGHCYSICPVGAVDMLGYNTDGCVDVTPMTEIDSDVLLQAMKSRRSVRHFKDMPIEQEKIDKILEAGRYSPTGANSQNVAYTILGSKQDDIEKDCVKMFRAGVNIGSVFSESLKNNNIDNNFFFKKAPMVIVVSGRDPVNASLASSYMELMAESLGIGVLYSGFFVACARLNPLINAKLNLPSGHKVVSCMVMGYPDVEYKRIAPRKALKVNYL